MAYKNLVSVSCNNPVESFLRFRDFLCANDATTGTYDYSTTGIGWTYHDYSYSVGGNKNTPGINDYFVVYSPGESGNEKLYFKITLISNFIKVEGYLYWNNTTHTGYKNFTAGTQWYALTSTNNILWVYGDLDHVKGIMKYGSSYYDTDFGCIPGSWLDQTISTVSNPISSGSSRTVTFSAIIPAAWTIGTKLIVRDTVNIEQVTITGISGNDVTFASFTNSYLANSRFSYEYNYYVNNYYSSNPHYLLISHSNTASEAVYPESISIAWTTGPDGVSGKYLARKIYLGTINTFVGPLKDQLATVSGLTVESLHSIDTTSYRFFPLYYNKYTLVKEV